MEARERSVKQFLNTFKNARSCRVVPTAREPVGSGEVGYTVESPTREFPHHFAITVPPSHAVRYRCEVEEQTCHTTNGVLPASSARRHCLCLPLRRRGRRPAAGSSSSTCCGWT